MLSKEYIVGLTDGEGCFNVYIRKPNRKHKAKNYRVECHYYLKLREDDLALIKGIKKFFKCGRISLQKDSRPNHRDCYRFEVTDLKSLNSVIIPFFKDNRLRSKKIIDFNLFSKVVKSVSFREHLEKKGLRKIKQWKSEMHK